MKIKAYLKPHCGWSNGVRAIMQKHNLAYEDIDIINHRANYEEMVRKSGQPLSPCVEIDGVMLADISGEEVENYLLANNLVRAAAAKIDVATNAGCSPEEHDRMAAKPVRFF
jgi:monothiol glutaredoxin